jgi:ACS family allantoate permease-like MFS transporter
MFCFILFAAVLLGSMGLLHLYWNKKRDAQDAQDAASKQELLSPLPCDASYGGSPNTCLCSLDGIIHEKVENEEFADITDFKLRSFRYAL